jgi:hypothetical protein
MVSCLAFAPDGGALAAGTYSQTIGIFDPRVPELHLLLQGHVGGLTQARAHIFRVHASKACLLAHA